jgi:membrane associated rhomboid family serine protease
MGLYDRDYTQADFQSKFHYSPQMYIGFPKVTPVVKWLLIANVAVFFISAIIPSIGNFIYMWFQLDTTTPVQALQLWRIISYQFLHGDFWHILFNMWALWMFGPTLENYWSSRRFLPFYLGCGAAGGLFYTLLVAVHFLRPLPMVGASGAILGVFAACAILFPNMRLILFPLPISLPIRTAAIAGAIIYIFIVMTRSADAGGNAAHLAGMATGAAYAYSESWRTKFKLRIETSRWQKKMAEQRNLQVEVDRILQKVHDFGIHSLTTKEKRTLQKATEEERTKQNL